MVAILQRRPGVVAPPSDGPDNVEPRVWAPNNCALRIFDGKAARACLRRRPLALVGDATTQGIFDELRLLAWDYEFPPGPPPAELTYVQRPARLDARLAQNIKSKYEPHMVIVNVGGNFVRSFVAPRALSNCRAYLGSFLRRVPHPTMPRFLVQNEAAIEERHAMLWSNSRAPGRAPSRRRARRGVEFTPAGPLSGWRGGWTGCGRFLGAERNASGLARVGPQPRDGRGPRRPRARERAPARDQQASESLRAGGVGRRAPSRPRGRSVLPTGRPTSCGCPAHDAARANRRCFDPGLRRSEKTVALRQRRP